MTFNLAPEHVARFKIAKAELIKHLNTVFHRPIGPRSGPKGETVVKIADIPREQRFWWFEGEAIHFDAPRYARLRGITVEQALAELQEIAARVAPGVPVEER